MPGNYGPPNQNQLSLVAGANVTLSGSTLGGSHTITIIGGGTGATGTGANVSAGSQVVGSGTVVFSNSNSISFGMSNSSVITASVAYPAISQSGGASNLGNLSGTSGIASGSNIRVLFAGGNNITLSQSVNGASATLSIIGTQTVQTQNLHNITLSGNTSGVMAVISSGTMTLVGGNNITLSQNGNAITISAPTPAGLQTAVSGLSAGTTAITSGTVSFANSNGVTFGINGQTLTASAAGGNQASLAGNTSGTLALISSGTLTLAGGNNVTLSQVGNAVTISGPNTSVQTVQTQSNLQAIVPLGNTLGTTGSVQTGTFGLAAGNNITISQSSGVNSTNLTIIGQAGVPSFAATGNTTGNFSIGGGSIALSGGNNVTLSGSTAAGAMTIGISVPNTASQSVQTQNLFDLQITSGAGGATSGTTALVSSGTLTLAAGSNITLSQNGNAITIVGPNAGGGGGGGAIQVSQGNGSTSGTTALMTLGTMTLVAHNNITLSQAGGNVISIQGVATAANVLGMSNLGNSSGTTGVLSGSAVRLVFAGQNNVTLSQSINGNSATLTIMDAPFVTNSMWSPPRPGTPGAVTYGQSVMMFHPTPVNAYVSATQLNVQLSVSVSTSSNSSHAGTLSLAAGFYTRNGSTLSSLSTGSVSYAWTNTSDNSTASLTGLRYLSIPLNINLTPGDYWIGFLSQSATANANWITLQNIVHSNQQLKGSWLTATNASAQFVEGMGHLSGGTNTALASSAAFSQITGTGPNDQQAPFMWFINHSE